MSPEQAAGDRDIDTRTDVFSLGVLLYELLTGATTIPRDQLERRSPFDVVKLVRDTEPLCPSRRLTAAEQSEDIERAAHDRAATPAGLARRLRGDLDCIVMTALERDRARRYATVDALALDVVHHLENRPISAHAPTTAYRLVKFARRNRAALLIVSLVFIALAGTSVGLVRSLAAEARARTDARIAHEINAFLNDDLLATAAPEELGVDVRVRDVLLAASQRIEGRFADEPEVEAAIRLTLGRTFTRLAEFDLARHHLTRAYELRAAHFGDADARTLEATHELAQWHTLTEHYPRAEELFAKAYKGRIACLGPDHYDTIASQQALAVSIAEQGRNAEAGPLFLDALARSRAANGPDHRQSLELLRAVGLVYESSHDIEKVIQAYDECYTRSRRAFGIGNTITLLAMCDLAGTLIERGAHGDRERARDLLVECLGASTKLRGPWHPATLTVMFNLAKIHSMMGDFGAAESTLGQARDAAVASLPPGHPLTTRFDLGLAEVYDAQGRHDEACTLLTRAVEQLRSTLGDDNPSTRAGVLMLAGHYTKLGKHDQAAKVKAQLPAALQSPGGAH